MRRFLKQIGIFAYFVIGGAFLGGGARACAGLGFAPGDLPPNPDDLLYDVSIAVFLPSMATGSAIGGIAWLVYLFYRRRAQIVVSCEQRNESSEK